MLLSWLMQVFSMQHHEEKVHDEAPKAETPDFSQPNKKIGLLLLLSFAVLIIFGFFFVRSSQERIEHYYFEYHGVKFTPSKSGVGYDMEFHINDAQYPVKMSVRGDPRELEDIPINITTIKPMVAGKSQIYIAIEPKDNLTGKTTVAAQEIDYFIDNPYLFNVPVNSSFLSFTNDSLVPKDKQVIKTCEDSDEKTTVLWLRLGNETAVFEEDGCIVVQGKSPDEMEIIRAADRFYLTMLGIMQ